MGNWLALLCSGGFLGLCQVALLLSWTDTQDAASKLAIMMNMLVAALNTIQLAWPPSRCASRGQRVSKGHSGHTHEQLRRETVLRRETSN